MKVAIYDTTLRDGCQAFGFSLTVDDKVRVAQRLDALGVSYIEGGWPGSNPRDEQFFQRARRLRWKHARLAAFGSTRRTGVPSEQDPTLQLLLSAETPVASSSGLLASSSSTPEPLSSRLTAAASGLALAELVAPRRLATLVPGGR